MDQSCSSVNSYLKPWLVPRTCLAPIVLSPSLVSHSPTHPPFILSCNRLCFGVRLCLCVCLPYLGTRLRGLGVEPFSGMPSLGVGRWLSPPGGKETTQHLPPMLNPRLSLHSSPQQVARGSMGHIRWHVGHPLQNPFPCANLPIVVFNKAIVISPLFFLCHPPSPSPKVAK